MYQGKLVREMNERWDKVGFGKGGVTEGLITEVREGIKRTFTPPQLEVFCDVLRLTSKQRDSLRKARCQDFYTNPKYAPEPGKTLILDLSVSSDYLELINNLLPWIQKIWVQGNPKLAIDVINDLSDQLLAKKSAEINDRSIHIQLLEVQRKLFVEKKQPYLNGYLPKRALYILRMLDQHIKKIDEELKKLRG